MTEVTERSMIFKLASAVVATAGITGTTLIYFYENYRIPLKVLETTVTFKDVAKDNEQLTKDLAKEKLDHASTKQINADTNKALSLAKDRSISQTKIIEELHQRNLFYPENFYPAGYGRPKVGDDVELIKTLFKPDQLEWLEKEDDDYKVKVSLQDNFFNNIEYTFDKKTRKVDGITFEAQAGSEVLVKHLTEIGGEPTRSRKRNILRWQISPRVNGFLIGSHLYMILDDRFAPLLWKDPAESYQ